MIPDKVLKLTQEHDTVTSYLAAHPDITPGDAAAKLYGKSGTDAKDSEKGQGLLEKLKDHVTNAHKAEGTVKHAGTDLTKEDLDRAAECGKFGERPCDLFLKIYHDILLTLDIDPLAGLVSPPLLGSRGVLPFSVISVIPDIMQHYYDVIIEAQTEVFLATNYWEASDSAKKVCDAFIELSKRAEKRGKKVVVKMMYDRGNIKQVAQNHILVQEEEWTSPEVKLPKASEMPWLEFELVNYHRPMLGTFHAKYMVVDRRVALLNSNNIQDRCNVEMMTHLEGPIVDSMYDMALLSWHIALTPSPPLIGKKTTGSDEGGYKFGMENRYASTRWLGGKEGEERFRKMGAGEGPQAKTDGMPPSETHGEHTDQPNSQDRAFISGHYTTIADHLNAGKQDTPASPTALEAITEDFCPHILHTPHGERPMALVNRRPHGSPGHGDTRNPQDVSWLAAIKYAEREVFIQTPTFNAKPVVEATIAAVKRGVTCILYVDVGFNDGGEALPYQGGTNEEVMKGMFKQLTDEEKARLQVYWYTAKDQDRPINAHMNKRNCHVKLMIIDGTVGIQGNGNQDAQSWFHSQEINVMIDAPSVCKEWRDGIRRNENTHLYGKLGDDGIWRDKEGNVATDGSGVTSGPKGLYMGIKGSILRVQGKGGFNP